MLQNKEILTKKIVIETLAQELEIKFSTYGFKYVKSKQHLIRKFNGGFDRILFTTNTGSPYSHQELKISFMTRIDAVSNIVDKFYDSRFRNMAFSKLASTVSSDYESLKQKGGESFIPSSKFNCGLCQQVPSDNEFILHNLKDIHDASIFLDAFIHHRVFSFFKKNKDLNYLNDNFKNWLLTSKYPIPLLSVMESLILMKLCKDPGYGVIRKKYRKLMHPEPGFEEDAYKAYDEIENYLKIDF